MSLLASQRQSTRLMVYAMVCTLVVAFGSIGAVFAAHIGPQYSLMGLFLGSALGAFIAVFESTIIGCMTGMLTGLVVFPLVYYFIDFETAYLIIFVLALFGAIMGEPLAYFWREAEEIEDADDNIESFKENDREYFDE
ncbi:MAG: hypothetical protein ACQETH_00765 [Candidatus Rifleibacteriota bacterium]